MSARRAVVRWAWRLFRREWRQQALILILLVVAVAATTFGLGLAGNSSVGQAATFGTADRLITLTSTGAQRDKDLAAVRAAFGAVDVIAHQQVAVPGSANPIDLRDQNPIGVYGSSTLHLNQGRWPQGAGEVAVTDRFHLTLGSAWNGRTVVGSVENPFDLKDRFALVAPGQLADATTVTVLVRAGATRPQLPAESSMDARGDDTDTTSVVVLVLGTIGLLFVGLLAVAGFTVMAQRRMRSLGMLSAIGAGHRHIRLVLVANGTVLGAAGALAGAVLGLALWFVLGPQVETLVGHRIDRLHLPWSAVLGAMLLAVLTATGAAWWPARAVARVPVVAALSARPATPRPAHRFALAGAVLLTGGLGALIAAGQSRAPYIIGGVVGTSVGLLLLAPLVIAGLGRVARFTPVATRLALRDLDRYRARSGAALAAIGLAVGIAAAVSLSAGVAVAKAAVPTGGNLPADQIVVWVAAEALKGPVPTLTPAQVSTARARADAIAVDLHAGPTLPLLGVVNPSGPQERGGVGGRQAAWLAKPHAVTVDGRTGTQYRADDSVPLFVATPELLRHYGIDPASIAADTDIITSRADLDFYDLVPGRNSDWRPKIQHADLPVYTSLPTTLITTHALEKVHFAPVAAGWLVQAPQAIGQADVDRAETTALAAGLSVESRPTGAELVRMAGYATAAGVAVALGVLATTVGLIRGESARDLRTLTAAGARRRTRRALTASTAGSLALTGALLGAGGAYLALLAWHHRDAHWLAQVPLPNLVTILAGLPVLAYLGAWVLAGKEPTVTARQALE